MCLLGIVKVEDKHLEIREVPRLRVNWSESEEIKWNQHETKCSMALPSDQTFYFVTQKSINFSKNFRQI